MSEANNQEVVGYRAPQVCKFVGITYRQLDYWARTELLRPSLQEASGSGSQRMYSFTDLVQLKVIKRLLDAGMSLKKIRSAVEILRTQLASDEPLADVTLLSDGHTIYAAVSPYQFGSYMNRKLTESRLHRRQPVLAAFESRSQAAQHLFGNIDSLAVIGHAVAENYGDILAVADFLDDLGDLAPQLVEGRSALNASVEIDLVLGLVDLWTQARALEGTWLTPSDRH